MKLSLRETVRKIFLSGIAGEIFKRQYGKHDPFQIALLVPQSEKVPPSDVTGDDQNHGTCSHDRSFPQCFGAHFGSRSPIGHFDPG